MACPPERYANLPIAPQYQQSLVAFCSDPNNAGACEQLCQASDEEIVASIEQIAPQLEKWKQEGIPDEIRNASPELANEFNQEQPTNQPEPEGVTDGIGALPVQSDPSIPPGQLADVPMPMDRPSPSPPRASNVSYRNGGFVNAPSYGLGGLVKDSVKAVKGAVGGNNGLLGGIIGGALAYYTGGMSVLAGASLGSAAGTYAGTGNLGMAAGAGLSTYGLGKAGMGIAGGTTKGIAGGAMLGAGLLAPRGAPPPPPSMMPTPAPSPHSNGPVRIPGSGDKPISSNPSLTQGLGSLPGLNELTMNNPMPESNDSLVSKWGGATQSTPISNINTSQDIIPNNIGYASEMEAYYRCVAENGAENCQMPSEMPDQQNPATIPTAQYAPNFMDGGSVDGAGTETSDSQPAWLSDNEFVMTADAVRGLGNGDVDQGANRMYNMMAQLERRGQS